MRRAREAFFLGGPILLVLLAMLGCGAGTTSSTNVPAAPVTPVSGSEFLYGIQDAIGGDDSLFVSTIDPTSGAIGPAQYASPLFGYIMLANAEVRNGFLVTPSTRLFYLVGSRNVNTAGIFGFAQTGSLGLLTPIAAVNPYPLTAPYGTLTGSAMDGKGRFLYASDSVYGNGAATVTNHISAFTINQTDGSLQAGPVLTLAGNSALFLTAADPAGRFIFGVREPPLASLASALEVFAIDQSTGGLTEVNGAPYPFLTVNGSTVSPGHSVLNATGNLLYVAGAIQSSATGQIVATGAMYVYAVDPASGALTAAPGSPYPLGNGIYDSFALSADGSFLYATTGTQGVYQASTYAVNPTTGAVNTTPISSVADARCCNDLLDPSGSVLIDYASSFHGGISAYKVSPTGALSAAQGSADGGYSLATVIRIP